MAPKTAFDLETCCRPNVLALEPYRCARDDYKDDGTNILLDANENAYGPGLHLDSSGQLISPSKAHTNGTTPLSHASLQDTTTLHLHNLNRYPDPHQTHLKSLLCNLRQDETLRTPTTAPLSPANLFVGVGSDEAIDTLMRCFCVPGRDRILICPPTYGMYTVSACVNDVGVVKVPLIPKTPPPNEGAQSPASTGDFALDVDGIETALAADAAAFSQNPANGRIKALFLCSPGNPTGALLPASLIQRLLSNTNLNGLLILDEAYIDFSPQHSSLAALVPAYPNLVVMQTLSKAFGLAGIRLGAAFADERVARVLNSVKAPYNVSEVTSQLAVRALQQDSLGVVRAYKERIIAQRDILLEKLPGILGIGRFRGGFDANFLLVEVLDAPEGRPSNPTALRVYETLAAQMGVVVRFRGKEAGCEGCLRITVGTEEEVERFLEALRRTLKEIYADGKNGVNGVANGVAEERKERDESKVVA